MGRLSKLGAALGAAALILAGGGAYAVASSGSGTITVCVKRGSGTLYKAKQCASHDKQLSWNRQGPIGAPGAQGAPGPAGPQGAQGPAGPAGPLTTTLPSGKTLRGVFLAEGVAAAGGANLGDSITFGWTLTGAPTPHYIKAGAQVPAGCSGSAVSPGAAPGNLCVFEVEHLNITEADSEVFDPVSDTANAAQPFGAAVYTNATAAGTYEWGGSWAVTAP